MTNYRITQKNDASSAEKDIIHQGLAAFNVTYFGYDDTKPLNFFIHDDHENIVGGLLGFTYWDFFAIDIFWLDQSVRGQGFGKEMLALAEQEAIQRGCTTVHLDTFEFQAPHFYEKYGFEQWGSLDGYAGKFKRIYYKKSLMKEKR